MSNTEPVDLSVLAIVAGRRTHLENVAAALSQSVRPPREWVVVGMGEDVPTLAAEPELARTAIVRGRVEAPDRLPLAEARAEAARLASSENLLFLDVDCLPTPAACGSWADLLSGDEHGDGLWMGDVRYLPEGAARRDGDAPAWTFATLADAAVRHPLLPVLEEREARPTDRYEMFWSLCFGLRKPTYDRIGGFDAGYPGYGAEDTDFAFAARAAGVPFGHFGAVAYHQYHPSYSPPLNHLESIVANARRFREKWGLWPMDKWLAAFAERGYVDFRPGDDTLEILALPDEPAIAAAKTNSPAGF